MSETLNDKKLAEIVNLTLSHYEDNALSFREGTKDHDVSQNYDNFFGRV